MKYSEKVKERIRLFLKVEGYLASTKSSLRVIEEFTEDLTDEEFEDFKVLYRFDKIENPKYFTSANFYKIKQTNDFSLRMRKFMLDSFIYYSSKNEKGFNKKRTFFIILSELNIEGFPENINNIEIPYGWHKQKEEYRELVEMARDKFKKYFGEKEYKRLIMENKLSR